MRRGLISDIKRHEKGHGKNHRKDYKSHGQGPEFDEDHGGHEQYHDFYEVTDILKSVTRFLFTYIPTLHLFKIPTLRLFKIPTLHLYTHFAFI